MFVQLADQDACDGLEMDPFQVRIERIISKPIDAFALGSVSNSILPGCLHAIQLVERTRGRSAGWVANNVGWRAEFAERGPLAARVLLILY